jgi:hypothetical protein
MAVVLIAVGFGITYVLLPREPAAPVASRSNTATEPKTSQPSEPSIAGLRLQDGRDYGNKYANGVLPVGDNKYSTSAAKVGNVYACETYARNFGQDQGGAGTKGPWFSGDGTTYDINKKAHVSGAVKWIPEFSQTISSSQRTIVTNDLPSHATGVFPVALNDAAYLYDRNPNRIQAQSLRYELALNPTYGKPRCMSGEVGIMLSGVALFSAFDAGGRDAGAWEVQDDCSGHPQKEGEYHYHTLSSCIGETGVNTIIGYALDGFPITGPKVGENNILTTTDLDECHGIVSKLTVNGKSALTYHYVMTQDFPYSLSCFRAAPMQMNHPPAQPQQP